MKKKTNTFLLHTLILLSFTGLVSTVSHSTSATNIFFLSPQSSLNEASENNFQNIYKTAVRNSKNIPAELKDQLLDYLNHEDDFAIKAQVTKSFPTNPKIYNDYIWSAGLSLVIGFDPKNEKIIIIPTSLNSGKDSGLAKATIINADSLAARNNISALIEEKHEEIILKKHILESGMDTISGFLFNVSLFEHYKILGIFTNIFLPLNQKETLYHIADNSFKLDNLYAKKFLSSVSQKIGADTMFSTFMDIIAASKEANNVTNNASAIIMHILPKIDKKVLLKKLDESEESHIQHLVSLIATEAPDTFVDLARYILLEAEDVSSPFIKNLFLKQMGRLTPENIQVLAINLERDSKNEKVREHAANLIANLGLHPYKNLLLIVHDLDLNLSLLNTPSEIYDALIKSLSESKRHTMALPVLELLNAIQPAFLPERVVDDISDFMKKNQQMASMLQSYCISIIARKNTFNSAKTLITMLADNDAQNTIKPIITDVIRHINPEHIFTAGFNMLKAENNYSEQQTINILEALGNIDVNSINQDKWIEVRNFIRNKKLSSQELHYALLLMTHINNTEATKFILKHKNQLEAKTKDTFSKLLIFIINNSADADTITEIAFDNTTDKKTQIAALIKLKDLRLAKTSAIKLLEQMEKKGTNPSVQTLTVSLLESNINDILLHIQPRLSQIIRNTENKDNFRLHASIITILSELSPYNITPELTSLISYANNNIFIFEQKLYADLLEKFTNQTKLFQEEKERSLKKISEIIAELKRTKDDNQRFNILINLEQTAEELKDKSFIPQLMKLIKDKSLLEDEIFMVGRVIIKSGYNHKVALANYIMPKLMEKDKLPQTFKESYPKLLKVAGLSHKLLLWQKTRLDWQKFGVSSKDIVKGYLHTEDKDAFIKTISELTNTENIPFENISWTNPTQSYVNEEFLPVKTINARQFQQIFNLLYSHLDTTIKTDILLGEEYEIIGRDSVPSYYYRIYEESNDENEIITPPSNPLYQKLFSRHVPSNKSGVHRTLEQRISSMDAKLITLFCQLYSKAAKTKDMTIGTDINPKEDDLWSIRYDQHDRTQTNIYAKEKFLLQTTDWKNHTSGTLMWYFMNYADKFPLKWIKLKELLLKKLENRDINIYLFTEEGDEVRVSTHKKYNSEEEIHIPKYIYDLTTYPKNEDDSVMRLLVNDEEIISALEEMIVYTSDQLVDGTLSEKKLYAIDVLNEIHMAKARGEVPEDFSHYRGTIAIHNSIEAINDYYRNKRAKASAKSVNEMINQSV